jgi:preprotein translocase subunit YajC
MGSYGSIILIVVMIIAFYFLIMRPQRRRQQQQVDMMKTLEPGARVVTTTGIYATIVAVGDKQIVLETSPGSRVTMLKQAVGRVVGENEEDAQLGSYRGAATATGTAAGSTTGAETATPTGTAADAPATFEDQPDQGFRASGLAGGAPIQEYAPGTGPDFAPAGDSTEGHQTAPWPPAASDPAGATAAGQDTAGESSVSDGDVTGGSTADTDDLDGPGERRGGEPSGRCAGSAGRPAAQTIDQLTL